MKFALDREHLDFFHKHHYIEFENLLTSGEIETLKKGMIKTLSSRLHKDLKQLRCQCFKTLYLAGFDTWRESSVIKKIAFRSDLAEVASSLVKKKPLRIGFDQAFCTPSNLRGPKEDIPSLFKHEASLRQTSCLQGIACGLILHLSSPIAADSFLEFSAQEDMEAFIPISSKEGNGIFFSPDMTLSLHHFRMIPSMCQLLLVYTVDKTLYYLNKEDPHTHAYKKLGYGFGDKLKNVTHPFLYR